MTTFLAGANVSAQDESQAPGDIQPGDTGSPGDSQRPGDAASDPLLEDPIDISLDELGDLSLDELLEVEVTVASHQETSVRDVPAAVTVISREDIERSGLQTVPELLRLVPGMFVARIDATRWAISARSFTDEFAFKMLVLIDGRQVYTPLFGGVHWDVQDLSVDEIERIEVIRGPGGARWGANAVNGVIHVITRNAADTQGGSVQMGIGTENRIVSTLRYGTELEDGVSMRVSGRYLQREPGVDAAGRTADDGQGLGRVSVRLDGREEDRDLWSLQVGAYQGESRARVGLALNGPPYIDSLAIGQGVQGAFVTGTWMPDFLADRGTTVRGWVDTDSRDVPGLLDEERRSFGVEAIQELIADDSHRLTVGATYRFNWLELGQTPRFEVDRRTRNADFVSVFLEDEVSITEDLRFRVGVKAEHNDFTGFEIQPDARLSWSASPSTTVWGAVSRAVHVPTFINQGDIQVAAGSQPGPGGLAQVLHLVGNDEVVSEELWSYEAGARTNFSDRALLDVAVFFGTYDDLLVRQVGTPRFEPDIPRIFVPARDENGATADSYGGEIALDIEVDAKTSIRSSYSFSRTEERRSPSAGVGIGPATDDLTPRHQAQLHLHRNFGSGWSGDVHAYFYDRIPGFDVSSWTRLDVHVGWRASDRTRFDLLLSNLLDGQHREASGQFFGFATEIERAASFTVTHDF